MLKKTNTAGFVAWGLLLAISTLITGLGLYASVVAKDLHDTVNYRTNMIQAQQKIYSCQEIVQRMFYGNTHIYPGKSVVPNCTIYSIDTTNEYAEISLIIQYPSYATTSKMNIGIHN